MNNRTRNKTFRLAKNEGFSLVELLIVLLIMSIISGIAIPLYINQKSRAYLASAQSDAYNIGKEISSIVSDYNSFGSSSATNTISIVSTFLTFGAMTSASGVGTSLSNGPGTTSSIPKISPNSSITGNYGIGTAMPWCIIVTNGNSYVKYTNVGLITTQIGGSAPTCALGI